MIRGTLALLGLGFCIALTPAPADAKPKNGSVEEARDRFQKGVQLFREGSYDAALAEFRKAYEIAPSYRLLYNIAQVQYERHDYVEAIKAFRQYLEEGGDEVPADRRAQVQSEIDRLDGLVARLQISINVEGAEIKIDDLPVGTSPLKDPVIVNSGQRRISATKPGYATVTRNLTVAGGDRTEIELELAETGGEAGTVPPMYEGAGAARSSSGPPPPEKDRTAMWIGVAATSAFAVGTGVFALLSMDAKEKFDAELERPTTKDKITDAREKMVLYAAVTDGLAVATVLAGGVTLYFALSDGSPSPKSGKRPTPKLAVSPRLGGVSFAGTF